MSESQQIAEERARQKAEAERLKAEAEAAAAAEAEAAAREKAAQEKAASQPVTTPAERTGPIIVYSETTGAIGGAPPPDVDRGEVEIPIYQPEPSIPSELERIMNIEDKQEREKALAEMGAPPISDVYTGVILGDVIEKEIKAPLFSAAQVAKGEAERKLAEGDVLGARVEQAKQAGFRLAEGFVSGLESMVTPKGIVETSKGLIGLAVGTVEGTIADPLGTPSRGLTALGNAVDDFMADPLGNVSGLGGNILGGYAGGKAIAKVAGIGKSKVTTGKTVNVAPAEPVMPVYDIEGLKYELTGTKRGAILNIESETTIVPKSTAPVVKGGDKILFGVSKVEGTPLGFTLNLTDDQIKNALRGKTVYVDDALGTIQDSPVLTEISMVNKKPVAVMTLDFDLDKQASKIFSGIDDDFTGRLLGIADDKLDDVTKPKSYPELTKNPYGGYDLEKPPTPPKPSLGEKPTGVTIKSGIDTSGGIAQETAMREFKDIGKELSEWFGEEAAKGGPPVDDVFSRIKDSAPTIESLESSKPQIKSGAPPVLMVEDVPGVERYAGGAGLFGKSNTFPDFDNITKPSISKDKAPYTPDLKIRFISKPKLETPNIPPIFDTDTRIIPDTTPKIDDVIETRPILDIPPITVPPMINPVNITPPKPVPPIPIPVVIIEEKPDQTPIPVVKPVVIDFPIQPTPPKPRPPPMPTIPVSRMRGFKMPPLPTFGGGVRRKSTKYRGEVRVTPLLTEEQLLAQLGLGKRRKK